MFQTIGKILPIECVLSILFFVISSKIDNSNAFIAIRGDQQIIIQKEATTTTRPRALIALKQSIAPSYGLYEVQEELITKRALQEEELMKDKYAGPIQANKLKGVGSSGGFGTGGKTSVATLRAQGKGHAQVLQKEGVVRIDNVLSKELCKDLSEFVADLRAKSEVEIEEGTIPHNHRFADVLLRKNRCDLTMPLEDITLRALYSVLSESSVGMTLEKLLGKKALLYEFSCLMSDYGSDRQNVHPDTPIYNDDDSIPVIYTCFIALQDVDYDMGPTLWMPNTHKHDIHSAFQQEEPSSSTNQLLSPKDQLLQSNPHVLGTLSAGSCGIFDSRLLHCGTANNKPDTCRKVFYVSFQNPKIGYPGNPPSIRPELQKQKLSLDVLKKELDGYKAGKGKDKYPTIEALASSMK